MSELYIFARFDAQPGCAEDLARTIDRVVPDTRAEQGCLEIHAYRSTNNPSRMFIHSRWRDEAAFDRHAELPHTVEFLARVRGLITHEIDVTRTRQVN